MEKHELFLGLLSMVLLYALAGFGANALWTLYRRWRDRQYLRHREETGTLKGEHKPCPREK